MPPAASAHRQKEADRKEGKKKKEKGRETYLNEISMNKKTEIDKWDIEIIKCCCVRDVTVCLYSVWFRLNSPCVWPCVCVTALPQRTWFAGVETSAGNTMVQSSWWVPPTVHSSVCRSLCVSAWVSSHPPHWFFSLWSPLPFYHSYSHCHPLCLLAWMDNNRGGLMSHDLLGVVQWGTLWQPGSQRVLHLQWRMTPLAASKLPLFCFNTVGLKALHSVCLFGWLWRRRVCVAMVEWVCVC